LRNRNVAITPEEENYRVRLEALNRELVKLNQQRNRINELFMRVNDSTVVESYEIDEESLKSIFKLLKQQTDGINILTNTLKQDLNDMEIINKDLMNISGLIKTNGN